MHLQPSPVMCFVNSFSLEGAERAAVKHYHPLKQASSHPRDRQGAADPLLHPSPAPSSVSRTEEQGGQGPKRGPALQTPSGTAGLSRLLPLLPCSKTGPATLLFPTPSQPGIRAHPLTTAGSAWLRGDS